MRFRTPAIIIHGGAGGSTPRRDIARRRQVMLEAVAKAAAMLREGASALDAAVAAVVVLENDPLFNAGYGSALNRDGVVEMDASVMVSGGERRAGAVAAVRGVRNPVMLARAVMEHTPHVLIVGQGARELARDVGLKRCRPQALISKRAKSYWETRISRACESGTSRARRKADRNALVFFELNARRSAGGEPRGVLPLKRESDSSGSTGMPGCRGTVGAVALDKHGSLAAATSTGGTAGKLPGRVGDSAIIGAGTFADASGAASATGAGEAILKVGLCREAVRALGTLSPNRAAPLAIRALAKATGAQAGIILLDRRGSYAYAHNAQAMDVACYDTRDGARFISAPPSRF